MLLFADPEARDLSGREVDLDARERARWESLRRPDDRRRYLVAHLGLRDALAERLGIAPGEVALGNDSCPVCGSPEHGRPVSLDDPDHIHWSISHTHGLVAVAVGSAAIGVDVESLSATSDTDFLDEVGTHPADAAALDMVRPSPDSSGAVGSDLSRARLGRWARLESVLKVTGAGLGVDPATVAVGLTGTVTTAVNLPGDGGHRSILTTVTDLAVGDSHVAALALSGHAAPAVHISWC